ncbi:MAG: DUF3000 domain-containing protein [Actinomycetia bacterium]|nr:DUF3000 domain-containing protein [Actinomycetes bacterium]
MPPPDASGASSAPTEQPRVAPELFRAAVDSLNRTRVRDEVRVEPMRPPQRLAPWSYAVSADIRDANGDEVATGRLVLLHDPDGEPAWGGVLRLVAYASADVDPDMARDPLLPNVGWSWLIDSLAERGAEHTASGGTVTQTTSTRFGDLAGPGTTTTLELRGSWTPRTGDLEPHLRAFADLLANAVGLPPEGVTALTRGR